MGLARFSLFESCSRGYKMSMADVDVFETERSVCVAVVGSDARTRLPDDSEKVNPNGGAIADWASSWDERSTVGIDRGAADSTQQRALRAARRCASEWDKGSPSCLSGFERSRDSGPQIQFAMCGFILSSCAPRSAPDARAFLRLCHGECGHGPGEPIRAISEQLFHRTRLLLPGIQQTSRKAVKLSRCGDHARWSPVNNILSRYKRT